MMDQLEEKKTYSDLSEILTKFLTEFKDDAAHNFLSEAVSCFIAAASHAQTMCGIDKVGNTLSLAGCSRNMEWNSPQFRI